jgi:hypothetical protein
MGIISGAKTPSVEIEASPYGQSKQAQGPPGTRYRSQCSRRREIYAPAPPRAPGYVGSRSCNDATGCRRVADDTRCAAAIDAARLGLPLGTHRTCQTLPGPRRGPRGSGRRTVGNAFGMGDEARASRGRQVAAFRWRGDVSDESASPGRPAKVQIPSPVASTTSGGICFCETVGATRRLLNFLSPVFAQCRRD